MPSAWSRSGCCRCPRRTALSPSCCVFAETRAETAAVRNVLTGHLLASGFYDETLGLATIALHQSAGRSSRHVSSELSTEPAASARSPSSPTLLPHPPRTGPSSGRRLRRLRCWTSWRKQPIVRRFRSPRSQARYSPFLHASAPDQSGGYAVRAHNVLKTIVANGYELTALTRPGFPEAANHLEPGATAEVLHDGIRTCVWAAMLHASTGSSPICVNPLITMPR
ncbi:hypothetical protein SAMN04489752_3627 [Brevibacterium siliguriense]|uniref:Uncharacterized protein n=1 Tax=Brevibacterium siliguriense TaxID=1136497 RepID=A0A1H1YBY1_9MICO|nr:hypothetical protein SAMN04489752_3627 [Brevibacterium siliguriense]